LIGRGAISWPAVIVFEYVLKIRALYSIAAVGLFYHAHACYAIVTSRRRLRASTSCELVIPLLRLVTVGDRSFAVAGPGSGTLCLRTLHLRRLYWFFDKTEDAFVSAVLSGHYSVACLACCARWSLEFFSKATLKIFNVR